MLEIASLAATLQLPQLTVVERIHDNKIPDTKPSIKRKTSKFVKVIRALRKLDEEVRNPRALTLLHNNSDHHYRAERPSVRNDPPALDND